MGYTITIEVKCVEAGQAMINFFKQQDVRSLERREKSIGLEWADGSLSYCKRPMHIGFDYGSDIEFKYTLLRWMLTKVGIKDSKTKQYRILYDDVTWLRIDPTKYDKFGMSNLIVDGVNPACTALLSIEIERGVEMARLDCEWDKTAFARYGNTSYEKAFGIIKDVLE